MAVVMVEILSIFFSAKFEGEEKLGRKTCTRCGWLHVMWLAFFGAFQPCNSGKIGGKPF